MRSIYIIIGVLFALALPKTASAQHVQHQQVMFWNVENAFWPEDDPQSDDDEFTPDGTRHWTHARLRQKLLQLTRVILAAGNGRAPMLVGLAEVEGDSVMHYWTHHTPMWDQHYSYLVTQGPDRRGIQTALLYNPSDFRLVSWQGHTVTLPEGTRPTRQILHAAGRLVSGDTLDVLVCHLPSRLGGARQSRPSRDAAHHQIMHIADSLQRVRTHASIIIMGDMNDMPSERTMWWGSDFSNLMLPLQKALKRHPSQMGSHKYQGQWSFLDQFIVNRNLFVTMSADTTSASHLHISQPRSLALPFMLVDDEAHLGHRPGRSYYGYQYEGGYSDHLPILLDLDVIF